MKTRLSVLSFAAPVAFVAYIGCGDGPAPSAPSEEGGILDASTKKPDGARDASTPRDGAGQATVTDFTEWAPWNTYSPACSMRVPASPSQMPPPFAWEACDPHTNVPGIACRRIKLDWDPREESGEWLRQGSSAAVLESGQVILFGAKHHASGTITFVADADGPFSTALYVPPPCIVTSRRGSRSHFAMTVLDGPEVGAARGILGGPVSAPAPTLVKRTTVLDRLTASSLGVVEAEGASSAVALHPWDGSERRVVFTGANVLGMRSWEDILAFTASRGAHSVKIYSEARGTIDLVNFNDSQHGAADPATDGKSWVWLEGFERATSGTPYSRVSWMTAPFVTDPALLAPRELRNDLRGEAFGLAQMVVGCGRAARTGTILGPAGYEVGIQIVDLATGNGYFLNGDPTNGLALTVPLALTCSEVFVEGYETLSGADRMANNIFRIQIESAKPWPRPL